MLEAIRHAGGAYRAAQEWTAFYDSLSDEQKQMLASLQTSVKGIVGSVVPDEIRPVVEHVFANDGDPVVVKMIGAWLHPGVKQSLVNLLPHSHEPMTIKCRFCQQVAIYGLEDQK